MVLTRNKIKQNKVHNPRGGKIPTLPHTDIMHALRRWSLCTSLAGCELPETQLCLCYVAGAHTKPGSLKVLNKHFLNQWVDKFANHPPAPQWSCTILSHTTSLVAFSIWSPRNHACSKEISGSGIALLGFKSWHPFLAVWSWEITISPCLSFPLL